MTTATRPTLETLLERVSAPVPAANIDESTCTIRNVKLLGAESENGRTYSDQAMREALELYRKSEINIDHPPKGQENKPRGLLESWARPINLRMIPGDGVYGDLRYLGAHRETPVILERIRSEFGIGLSHNAQGRLVARGGKRVVESVVKVNSIDLVPNPATNKTLFESRGNGSGRLDSPVDVLALMRGLREDVTADLPGSKAVPVDRESWIGALQSIQRIVEKPDLDDRSKVAEIKKIFGDRDFVNANKFVDPIKGTPVTESRSSALSAPQSSAATRAFLRGR